MKRIFILFSMFVLVESLLAEELTYNWQLPIAIGDERFIVYQNLGIPNEIISQDTPFIGELWPKEKTNEYFYEDGLVVIFWNNKVSMITINTLGGYNGWNDYNRKIINEVTLEDDRNQVIKKLGKPFLMKTDPLYKTDKDEFGLTRYSNSYYIWELGNYRLEIEIANSDQMVDENKNIIRQKDRISLVVISDRNY